MFLKKPWIFTCSTAKQAGANRHKCLTASKDFTSLTSGCSKARLTSRKPLCSEHTGRYSEHLLDWTSQQGWTHAVVKTTALQKVTEEHHRKSDGYDAKKLAEYGHRFCDRLRFYSAPKKAAKQIKRLRNERKKMVAHRASIRQKLTEADCHSANMQTLKSCWNQQQALLSEHIDALETQIQTLINQDRQLKKIYRRMLSAPGIGKVIASFWLSECSGQTKLNPRKIASRYGFAPHSSSSGSSISRPNRSSGFGNGYMRRLMHQAARSVATHHPHYKTYYNRKLQEGKHQLVAINNIICKLIRLYCALWNKQTSYDPNYINKMKKEQKMLLKTLKKS